MATNTSAGPKYSLAIVEMVFAVLAGIAATKFRFEGGALLWALLLVISLAEKPIEQPRAKNTPPTPQTAHNDRHYQAIHGMAMQLVWPVSLFNSGMVQTSLVITAGIGVLIGVLPLEPLKLGTTIIQPPWLHIANGLLGALSVSAIFQTLRNRKSQKPPATTVQQLIAKAKTREIVTEIIVVGVAVMVGILIGGVYTAWLEAPGVESALVEGVLGIVAGVATLSLVVGARDRKLAKEKTEREDSWMELWPALKVTPPTMIHHHTFAEGVEAQWFRVPVGEDIKKFVSSAMIDQLTTDDTIRVVQAARPLQEDGTEDLSGELSTGMFRVVSWSKDHIPSFTREGDGEVDLLLYGLWIDIQMANAAVHSNMPFGYLQEIRDVSDPEAEHLLFEVKIYWPDGPFEHDTIRPAINCFGPYLGWQCIADCFLNSSSQNPDPEKFQTSSYWLVGDPAAANEATAPIVESISANYSWEGLWEAAGLTDNPSLYADRHLEQKLTFSGNRRFSLSVDLFSLSSGQTIDMVRAKDRAKSLITAMEVQHVAIVPSVTQSKKLFIEVIYSNDEVERDLSKCQADQTEILYLFNMLLDEFLTAHGAKSQFVSRKARKIDQGLWQFTVPVETLNDFQFFNSRLSELARFFGQSKWLRLEWSPGKDDNLIHFYFGISKEQAQKTYSPKTMELVNRLDLQYAWLVAGVKNKSGAVPTMLGSKVVAEKTQLIEAQFELPEGLTAESVKGSTAALMSASQLAFIDIRAVQDNPRIITVLMSDKFPLATNEPYDAQTATASDGLSLGRGIDGASVDVYTNTTPHLLINGATGTGKAQPLTCSIPVPVSSKFPSGQAVFGELAVGDSVFTETGGETTIIGLSPITQERLYRVRFASGAVVSTSPDHLWRVQRARPDTDPVGVLGLHHLNPEAAPEEVQGLVDRALGDSGVIDVIATTQELGELDVELWVRMPDGSRNVIKSVEVTDSIESMRCLLVDSPTHLYLTTGGIPTHNSVLGRNIIVAAFQRGDEVVIIDPVKNMADFQMFKPYLRWYAEHTVVEALGVMELVAGELARRKAVNQKYGADNFASNKIPPEDRYPRMLVFIDEAMSLLSQDATSSAPDTDQLLRATIAATAESRKILPDLIGRVFREARSMGITVVIGFQKLDSKIISDLGLPNDVKFNSGRILLGDASTAVKQSVFNDPASLPNMLVPASGRGIYEPISGAKSAIFQGWSFGPDELPKLLESLDLPTFDWIDPVDAVPDNIRGIINEGTAETKLDRKVAVGDDFLAFLDDEEDEEELIEPQILDFVQQTEEEEKEDIELDEDDPWSAWEQEVATEAPIPATRAEAPKRTPNLASRLSIFMDDLTDDQNDQP